VGCRPVGAPAFSSLTTGWTPVQCDNQEPTTPLRFLVTHDSGVTWTLRTVGPNDGCCSNTVPRFFDDSNGWIMDTNNAWLLMTIDGGETWTHHGLPPFTYFACQGKYGPTTCSNETIVTGTFISPNQGWVMVSKWLGNGTQVDVQVERTLDGGKTWTVLSSRRLTTGSDLGFSLAFVDPNHGFMWSASELFRTSDGGRTWTAVQVIYS
jgi:photosystem II stability/assembly factor-like uncharacterized protein